MQLTNTKCTHLPQNVTKSNGRVTNLTQGTKLSSDATHQPMAHRTPQLPQVVTKSRVRVPNLTQVTYLPQMQITNTWPIVLLTITGCNQKQGESN